MKKIDLISLNYEFYSLIDGVVDVAQIQLAPLSQSELMRLTSRQGLVVMNF